MGDGVSADDWKTTLDDLTDRRVAARVMGGEERLTKHRAGGKLDARARVGYLLDPDGNVFGLISSVLSDGSDTMAG